MPCAPMASPSSAQGSAKVDWSALWSLVVAVLAVGGVCALVYAVWHGQRAVKYEPLDTVGIEMAGGEDFGTGSAIETI